MSQDDQNKNTGAPADNSPRKREEDAYRYDPPEPMYDGRIPDDDPPPAESTPQASAESPATPSSADAGSSAPGNTAKDDGAAKDDSVPPYLYDEDGNFVGSVMVEPGDKVPQDAGVRAEDPYRVEPYTETDQPYSYDYYEDNYADTSKDLARTEPASSSTGTTNKDLVPAAAASTAVSTPPGGGSPPPGNSSDDEDEDDDGMLRMSFMDHLEELRSRLLKIVGGMGVAFAASIYFSPDLWRIIQQPAEKALTELGIDPPSLTQITPMEAFNVVYIKLPLIASLFIASPWILYQIWAFIAPGLYKRERRWAGPFVIGSAGLFILGGLFAYFVAFRFGLGFLLGIGRDINITPMVSISEYFDLFVNVVLAISLVFELPVLIFFLTLLRIVNPGFLVRNSRYAILGIVMLAAVITPTPDVFNLMIFSVPMIVLFFVGVLLSYVLVLHQEGRRFPWHVLYWTLAGLLAIVAGVLAVAIFYYGYRWQWAWPFLIQ